MTVIRYELTIEESNLILAGLGELPAKASFNLIHKMQVQAAPQMPSAQDSSSQNQENQNG